MTMDPTPAGKGTCDARSLTSGHEIGVHAGHTTFRTPSANRAKAERLHPVCAEEGIIQDRSEVQIHYLPWLNPTAMRGLIQAGIQCDSTLGHAHRIGLRHGFCVEFPTIYPVAGRPIPLRIRPLIAMEQAVCSAEYIGLRAAEATLEALREVEYACISVCVCVTLTSPNSTLREEAEQQVYQAVRR